MGLQPRKYIKPKHRDLLFEKTKGKCALCAEELEEKFAVTYIVNPARFNNLMTKHKQSPGTDIPSYLEHLESHDGTHPDNMLACCISCNLHKKDMSVEQFREKVVSTVGTLDKHNMNYKIAKRFDLIKETDRSKIIFYFEFLESYNNKVAV